VLAIQARPVLGADQFSVRVRESGGRIRRVGGLAWFRTDAGAYFGTLAPGRDGQDWGTITPAENARLLSLADLLS
jgi:EspG family